MGMPSFAWVIIIAAAAVICVFVLGLMRQEKKKNKTPKAGEGMTHDSFRTPAEAAGSVPVEQEPAVNNTNGFIRKKRPLWKWVIPCTAAAIIITAGVYTVMNYSAAKDDIEKSNFSSADRYLKNLLIASIVMPNERAYVDAGLLLEDGNYEEALAAFTEMGELFDAEEMAKEAAYRQAGILAESDIFDDAIRLYDTLEGYKDSKALALDAARDKGLLQLDRKEFSKALLTFNLLRDAGYEQADELTQMANYEYARFHMSALRYYEAYQFMSAALGYKDSSELLQKIIKELYQEAVAHYTNREYSESSRDFGMITGYLDSNDYILLCDVRSYYPLEYYNDAAVVSLVWDKLVPMLGFADTSNVILAYDDLRYEFLSGTWKGDGKTLIISEDGATTDLPFPDYVQYWNIKDGIWQAYSDDTAAEDIWSITIVSKDCLMILVYSNTRSYTLYRK